MLRQSPILLSKNSISSAHSPSMDFDLHAGNDESSFQCTPPNEYFVSKVSHEMQNLLPPIADHKAIARKIMKERIRQEILVREMAERRILEAEVRREIEIERMMEMRRIQMERLSLLAGTGHMEYQGNQFTQPLLPSWTPQATGGSSPHSAQDAAEFTFRERSQSQLLKKMQTAAVAESSLHHKSEKLLPSEERKTPEKFLVQTEKEWGCALCEVHAPSESGLKSHLEGKKHKAKLALLGSKKTITDHKESAFPSFKKTNPMKEPLLTSQKKHQTLQMKGASGSGPRNEKQPPAKGASASVPAKKLWCPLCKVMCNSATMLENHRRGKKHRASVELKKAGKSFAAVAAKEEVGAGDPSGRN